METEKKYFGGWWVWILVLIIPTILIFTALNYAGIIGHTIVEREVFENSFQYSESRKSEIATYEAQLSEISAQLSFDIDTQTRAQLEAQAASIRVLLTVARSK